jgi:hypothetical protein
MTVIDYEADGATVKSTAEFSVPNTDTGVVNIIITDKDGSVG